MPVFRIASPACYTKRTRRQSLPIRGLAKGPGTQCLCTRNPLPWPTTAPKGTAPTPYDIFNLDRSAAYDKRAFYAMVKAYHPDHAATRSSHTSCDSACYSHAGRLERFHLIVAAHAILSDPSKRAAYDRYGVGWPIAGRRDVSPHDWTREQQSRYEGANRAFGSGPQQPVFMSYGSFALCVLLVAAVGGYGQATRAGNSNEAAVRQRDFVHAKVGAELERTRRTALAFGDREERTRNFVRRREAVLRDQAACGFPPQETCSQSRGEESWIVE